MEVHCHVEGKLRLAGQAMKETYDRRMREVKYSTDDRVWLYNFCRKQGLSPKLQNPLEGPYTVVVALSAVTYHIRRGWKRPSVVHVDRLWHYSWRGGEAEEEEHPGSSGEGYSEAELAAGDVAASLPRSPLP